MSPVDEHFNSANPGLAYETVDRKHHPGLAGDVIHQQQTGPLAEAIEDDLHHVVFLGEWKRNRCDDDPCPGTGGHGIERVATGVVLVVGDQKLIPGLEG